MLMCIQNLVRFCQAILKILNGNELFTERQNDGKTEDGIGQGESSIAPLFQSGAIKIFIANAQTNANALAKFAKEMH